MAILGVFGVFYAKTLQNAALFYGVFYDLSTFQLMLEYLIWNSLIDL